MPLPTTVLVAGEPHEVAVAFVVELDAHDLLVFAELPAEHELARGHRLERRGTDAGREVERIGHLVILTDSGGDGRVAEFVGGREAGSTVRTWVKLE